MVVLIIVLAYFFCVALCYAGIFIKERSFDNLGWMCFDPRRWVYFVMGKFIGVIIPYHVFFQYALRVFNKECSECVKIGKCKSGKCVCDVYEKMFIPNIACDNSNYDKIKWSKKEFNDWIEKYPHKIIHIPPSILKDKEKLFNYINLVTK